jgi:magnesium-transporting ATPase (P-type)
MNTTVIGAQILGVALSIAGYHNLLMRQVQAGYYIFYLAVLITCLVFIDSRRRMQQAIQQIPMLRKSERVFWKMCAIFTIFLIAMTLYLVLASKFDFFLKTGFHPSSKQPFVMLTLNIIQVLLSLITTMVCWIALKYN